MSEDLTTTPSLADAALLARSGEYAEAEKVLRELGGKSSTDPAVLDLLARIHAQRGELFDADECWALALRLDADFVPARTGRKRIATLVSGRLRPRTGRVALAAALVAAAIGAAGVTGGLLMGDRSDPAMLAELDDIQDGQREQADRLDDLDDRLDQPVLRQQRVLDNLHTALAGNPALVAGADAGAVVVTFSNGVFRTGARLSEAGTTALADLVRRLGPSVADVTITVVGHTEDARVSRNSGYTTNAELGLARATVAAERMSEASGLPLSTFLLSSSGAANPPFPNTTARSRAQNRTVTVVVRPR
jgi:outer membrane protein OmpA-like peptidoglycan-associated protein